MTSFKNGPIEYDLSLDYLFFIKGPIECELTLELNGHFQKGTYSMLIYTELNDISKKEPMKIGSIGNYRTLSYTRVI